MAASSYAVEPVGIGRKKRRKSKKKPEVRSDKNFLSTQPDSLLQSEETILQEDVDESPVSLPHVETVTPKPAVKKGKASKKSTVSNFIILSLVTYALRFSACHTCK